MFIRRKERPSPLIEPDNEGFEAEEDNERSVELVVDDDEDDDPKYRMDAEEKRATAKAAEEELVETIRLAEQRTGRSLHSFSGAPRSTVLQIGRRIASFRFRSNDAALKNWNCKLPEPTFIKVAPRVPASQDDSRDEEVPESGSLQKREDVKSTSDEEMLEESLHSNEELTVNGETMHEEKLEKANVNNDEDVQQYSSQQQQVSPEDKAELDLETILEDMSEELTTREPHDLRSSSEEKENNESEVGVGFGKGLGLFRRGRKSESLENQQAVRTTSNKKYKSDSKETFWGRIKDSKSKHRFVMVNMTFKPRS